MRTRLSALTAALLLSIPPAADASAQVDDGRTPEAVVEAFHQALRDGDRSAALAQLDADVVIFESGGAEMSRDEYSHHHLEGDMRFSAALQSEITGRETGTHGETAWVLTRTRTRGTYDDSELDLGGTETMVLLRANGAWRIVHIHWSSRSKS